MEKNSAEYYMQIFLEFLMNDLVSKKSYLKKGFKELQTSPLGKFLSALNKYKNDVKSKDQHFIEKEKVRFVNDNFDTYCLLTDDDIWMAIKKLYYLDNKEDCSFIAKCLIKRTLPSYYALSPSRILYSKQLIQDFSKKKSIKNWQLHVDDLNFVSYEQEKESIYMVDVKDKKIYSDIFYESNFLNLLSGKKEYNYFLYIDHSILQKCDLLLNSLNKNGCLIYPYLNQD